jgi:integrase
MRFTELAISRLRPPPSGEVVVWDAVVVGFGCRLSHTGRKTWITAAGGAKRRIGVHPDMPLAAARARADALLTAGAPKEVTFKELVEQFVNHGRTKKGRPLRADTLRQYRANFAGYAKPLHRRRVSEITRRDIAGLINRIASESGGPTASLVRSMIARLFAHAIELGYIDSNPVVGTPAFEVAKRTRTLTDPEIAALWAATEEPFRDYNLILRLCLWCGVRRGEAGGARWSELQDGLWIIPGTRSKNGNTLVLPLATQAREALARWPRVLGKDLLFGRNSPNGFGGWSLAKSRLDKRLKFANDFNIHDLRRTVDTRLAKLGVNKEVRSRILNHDIGEIEGAYQHHDFLEEKSTALQRWADELESIVARQPQVISLARAADGAAEKGP